MISETFRKLGLLSIASLLLITTLLGSLLIISPSASGLSGSDFRPGRIIDDSIFYNSNAMSAGQIQQFLDSKNPNCDYNGTQSASDWGYPGITHAQLAERLRTGAIVINGVRGSSFHAPPYKCTRMYSQATPQMEAASGLCSAIPGYGSRSGAQIIKDVASACGINPQVLLVLLEKEQSLITDKWPLNRQLETATGFACPDTAPCNPAFGGFYYQVYHAARQFKVYQKYPNSYNYVAGRTNKIYYQVNLGEFVNPSGNANDPSRRGAACGYTNVYIENQATAALYVYTPYQPNQQALANLRGTGDACSAYGNRNFWRIFNDWFGSTLGTVYNGVDYKSVFDATYYLNRYPDVKAAVDVAGAFNHFIEHGIKEGRQGSENFNITSYKNRYSDLRMLFGNNVHSYAIHYISNGQKEGRIATGNVPFTPVTTYRGVDYSAVYNYDSYLNRSGDVRTLFTGDDFGAIDHFTRHGMNEGRQGNDTFNVRAYSNNNPDLRSAFGNDLKSYYLHYINYGKKEGRIAIGGKFIGLTTKGSTNYSAVYSFTEYFAKNPDLARIFGSTNDTAALDHFVNYGMKEGRPSSATFNLQTYKNSNLDLRVPFGADNKAYYLHYINYGLKEGRTAI